MSIKQDRFTRKVFRHGSAEVIANRIDSMGLSLERLRPIKKRLLKPKNVNLAVNMSHLNEHSRYSLLTSREFPSADSSVSSSERPETAESLVERLTKRRSMLPPITLKRKQSKIKQIMINDFNAKVSTQRINQPKLNPLSSKRSSERVHGTFGSAAR